MCSSSCFGSNLVNTGKMYYFARFMKSSSYLYFVEKNLARLTCIESFLVRRENCSMSSFAKFLNLNTYMVCINSIEFRKSFF